MPNSAIVWPVLLPLLGAVLSTAWPGRSGGVALACGGFTTMAAAHLSYVVYKTGPVVHAVGGWTPGLGIALRADGLSAVLLLMTAVVSLAVSAYAVSYFRDSNTRARFWPLWLLMWCSLNAIYLSGDLFNLYVGLELMGLSAVALVVLNPERESLRAAFRYLLVGLAGSMLYLAGVALLYTGFGSLDLHEVATRLRAGPAAWVALSLITTGLLLKTALFPLHFWLPPAHANADAPVSSALSALVVKAAFYLVLRLWLDLFAPVATPTAANLLGALGAIAILWGSWQALRAERVKLVAAYSTVAQLGYLFLFFPLLFALPQGAARDAAFAGLVLMAVAHGFAKSALFMSAGIIQRHGGNDRIQELHATLQALPATSFTLALAGTVLIGLPPSAAFLGKWQLIRGAFLAGQWLTVVVVTAGTLLAAGYVFRLLSRAFGTGPYPTGKILISMQEIPPMLLAIVAIALGLGAAPPFWKLLGIHFPTVPAL